MPLLPEAIIRCPKCHSSVCDIDPKWISAADKAEKSRGTPPWSTIRSLAVAQFREFGPLKGWMTQGECPEKECDGKWWDGTKLNVAVPHHLKEAKANERESDEGRGSLRDGPGDPECVQLRDQET
jgi:hypothetical protein